MEPEEATLTDWVWVEAMVMQAMVGVLTPAIGAVGLSQRDGEWIVTFFLREPVSEDVRQDLVEISGDAETFLEQCKVEQIHATMAIHRPVRSVIVERAPRSIGQLTDLVDRLLLAQSPE